MTCAVCHIPVEPQTHTFYDGLPHESAESLGRQFPTGRVWSYTAALYHFDPGSGDSEHEIVNFCGPVCSTRYRDLH